MRTTLTLEPDVAERLKLEVRRRGVAFKTVVNEALRAGLNPGAAPKPKRFKVEARHMGLKPGIDPDKMGQFYDQLEVEDFLEKYRRDLSRDSSGR